MRARDAIAPAIVCGVVASFAMDAVQDAFAKLYDRRRPADARDEEVEGIASLVRIVGRYVPAVARADRARAAAHVVHYAFGIAFAGAYVVLAERAPVIATSRGFVFGSALFIASDRILIPVLRLGRSWARYSRLERTNAFLSHVAYGMMLDAVRRRLRPRRVATMRAGYGRDMHNEGDLPDELVAADETERDDARRTAVTAADDTGMLVQHEIVVMDELAEPVPVDDAHAEGSAT